MESNGIVRVMCSDFFETFAMPEDHSTTLDYIIIIIMIINFFIFDTALTRGHGCH